MLRKTKEIVKRIPIVRDFVRPVYRFVKIPWFVVKGIIEIMTEGLYCLKIPFFLRNVLEFLKLKPRKLIFLHIPKCGGTSLHELLLKNFDQTAFCPERHNQFEKWNKRELNQHLYYSGHFRYTSVTKHIAGKPKIITILREPKARILSAYYFGRSHTWQFLDDHPQYSKKPECYTIHGMSYQPAKELSLKEFLLQEGPYLKDLMTRWFCPENCPSGLQLSIAQSVIDSFYAVGVLEYFDLFTKYVLNKIGFSSEEPIPHRLVFSNLTESASHFELVEKEPMTKEIDTLLNELTCLDRQLYEYAKERCIKDLGEFESKCL